MVEDAYWEDDNTAVLLEVNDSTPIIAKYDIEKNTLRRYQYRGKVKFSANYSIERITKVFKAREIKVNLNNQT